MAQKKRYRACVQVHGEKVWLQAETKRELQRMKVDTREHLKGGFKPKKDITFAQLLRNWFNNEKLPTIQKHNTIEAYKNVFRRIQCAVDPVQLAKAVTRHDIQQIMNTFEGTNKNTARIALAFLRSACQSALADGLMLHDPCISVRMPFLKPQKHRDALTDTQTDKMLISALQSKSEGVIIFLLYYLGIRIGEALALQWRDFDFDNSTVHISKTLTYVSGSDSVIGTPKSASSDRVLPVPSQLLNILRQYRGLPSHYLFQRIDGKPYRYYDYIRVWTEITTRAGLVHTDEDGKQHCEITAHNFRHNYITMLFDAGVPAQVAMRLAGHSRYNITADIYTHIKQQRIRQQVVKLDDIFRTPEKTFAKPLPNQQKQTN